LGVCSQYCCAHCRERFDSMQPDCIAFRSRVGLVSRPVGGQRKEKKKRKERRRVLLSAGPYGRLSPPRHKRLAFQRLPSLLPASVLSDSVRRAVGGYFLLLLKTLLLFGTRQRQHDAHVLVGPCSSTACPDASGYSRSSARGSAPLACSAVCVAVLLEDVQLHLCSSELFAVSFQLRPIASAVPSVRLALASRFGVSWRVTPRLQLSSRSQKKKKESSRSRLDVLRSVRLTAIMRAVSASPPPLALRSAASGLGQLPPSFSGAGRDRQVLAGQRLSTAKALVRVLGRRGPG